MIPFHKAWFSGEETRHIDQAIANQSSPEARHYTLACENWLEGYTGSLKCFLTPSCTAALEMAAILANIQAGDEVIMASFTFPSMANAFVLRGGIPIFVDIRPDTLNIDEALIEPAITSRTRAIVVMHYGGAACEMDTIMAIANKHGLLVIEDAAHALGASYKGRKLGAIGHLATLSFHTTKNIQCGEGGAILINDRRLLDRAENVRECGTDRSRFLREKGKPYTWVDVGSSFIISEFSAAFLWAQICHINYVLEKRKSLWNHYQENLYPHIAPPPITHSAHIFYITTDSRDNRRALEKTLHENGVQAISHYQPLHASSAGALWAKSNTELPCTMRAAETLLRLPIWVELEPRMVEKICNIILSFYEDIGDSLPPRR